jgi:hypothetical protein
MGDQASTPESALSYDAESYSAFLRSDGYSGEIAAMKIDWLRRMRLEIVDQELKYCKCCQAIKAHEASGGDAKDVTYLRNKFIACEYEKDRSTMAIDAEEGNVRDFEALCSFLSHALLESYEDIRVSLQRNREIPGSAATKGLRLLHRC